MSTFLRLLTTVVVRRPALVVTAVVAVTALLAGLASQSVTVDDDAAIDSPAVTAQEQLTEVFGTGGAVVQVLVRSDEDVRGADGLAAVLAIREAVDASPAGERVNGPGGQPGVVSFLAGAEQAAQQAGLEAADVAGGALSDDEVAALQERGLDEAPAQLVALTDDLIAEDEGTATTGLVVVFLDTEGLTPATLPAGVDTVEDVDAGDPGAPDPEEAAAQALELAVADAVAQAPLPAGVEAEPFSFGLLFSDQDIGPEVGQLFATAFAIILAVLAVVYWVQPGRGQRARVVRRTAADVALTLAAIVFAVVWMQGAGVLLGPDYLGLIGYFTAQTQIVPILVVGLGVDYAIHFSARYRDEVGAGRLPDDGVRVGIRTVGVALVLATATTVTGFLTNLASPVAFLRTFGVLAAAGIAAAFVITLTFVPAARLLLDRRATRRATLPRAALASVPGRALPRLAGRTAWLAERVPATTLAVAAVLAVAGGVGLTQLESRFSLTDFVPQDSPRLATFETLQEEFDGGLAETTEVLLTGPVATPDAHNALVAAIDDLADISDVQTRNGDADAESVASALGIALAQDGEELGPQLAALGLTGDGTVAADADVAGIYDALLDAAPDAAGAVLADTGDGWTSRVAVRTSGGEDAALALATEIEEAFAPVAAEGVDVAVTSQEIVQAGVAADVEDSQLVSLAIALGAAMLLLTVNFWITARRPMLGVITIAPVALVLAWTFGTMALTGIPLSPVTATLAALAIGIGVPFTIHVTHRFQEVRAATRDLDTALRTTAERTGGALAGSALTTMIGFGVLSTSSLLPFRQLGIVTVYAIGFALLAALLVLPSLLALWDRWHTARGRSSVDRDAVTVIAIAQPPAPDAGDGAETDAGADTDPVPGPVPAP